MAKEVSKVGLDASQFISEVARMQQAINKYNNNLAGLASATDKVTALFDKFNISTTETSTKYGRMTKMLDKNQTKITQMAIAVAKLNGVSKEGTVTVNAQISAGKNAVVTLRKEGEAFKVVAVTVNTSTEALKRNIAVTNALAAAKRVAQSALGAEIGGARGRGQTTFLLKEQQRVMNRLLAQRRLEAELIKNSAASLSMQLRIQQQILYTKIKSQAASEGRSMKGVLAENLHNMDEMKKKMASVGKTNKGVVNDMVLSWKTFERVMLVHIIRRVFHRLIMILREALTAIVEFHKGIVEIRTIAQEHQATIKQWADSLTQLSNAYGVDLMDATNAYYQVLSNQVAKGIGNVEKFTDSVLKFAKVTRSTAEESVNLLTAAINAYGMASTQVDRVAALMFKTIELGRVRVADLANTFGRATVPAAQMGITLEELNASIAAISIRGVKGTETMTLLRGIIMKLANPTTELTALMTEWGYSSAEAMIAAEGWLGVLKRIFIEAGNSMSKTASIFGRIRPAMGIAALISDIDKLEETMAQFGEAADRDYMSALQDQFQTSGEKFQLFTNQMKNFKKDIGEGIANFLTDITSKLDTVSVGLDGTTRRVSGLTKIVKFFVSTGTTAIVMLGIWSARKRLMNGILGKYVKQSKIANDATKTTILRDLAAGKAAGYRATMNRALIGTTITLSAVLAVTTIVWWTQKVWAANTALKDFVKQNDLARLKLAQTWGQPLKEATKELENFTKKVAIGLADVRASLSKSLISDDYLKDLEKSIKKLHTTMNNEIKNTGNLYKNIYDRLKNDIKDTKRMMEDNAKSLLSFTQELQADKFESQQRNRSPQQQMRALRSMYEGVAKNFKQDLAAGLFSKTAEGFERGEKALKEMQKLALELANLDRTAEQRNRKNRGFRDPDRTPRSEDILQKRIDEIIKQTAEFNKVTKTAHEQQLLLLEGRKKDLRDQFKGMVDTIAQGNKDIQKKLMELDPFKNEGMQAAYDAFIAGVDITTDKLKESIDKWVEQFKRMETIKLNTKNIENALDVTKKLQEELTSIINERNKRVSQVQGQKAQLVTDKQTSVGELEKILKQVKIVMSIQAVLSSGALNVYKQIKTIEDLLGMVSRANIKDSPKMLGELNKELITLTQLISELPENMRPATGPVTGIYGLLGTLLSAKSLETQIDAISDMQGKFGQLKGRTKGFGKIQEEIDALSKQMDPTEKESLQSLLDSLAIKFEEMGRKAVEDGLIPVQDGVELTKKAFIEFGQQAVAQGLLPINTELEKMIGNATTLIEKLREIHTYTPPTTLPKNTANKYMGGAIYARRGMFTQRGRDTVPIMAEPGEFIMNKRATSKFMEQVTPMNYGLEPNRFSRSQDVNVGDITVNISNPSGSSEVTARQIGEELRNEIRRGTFRF